MGKNKKVTLSKVEKIAKREDKDRIAVAKAIDDGANRSFIDMITSFWPNLLPKNKKE